jgi:hypothetical protein
MDQKRLRKLRREMEGLRRSQPKAMTLVSFARKLGRKKVSRGKEPTYESEEFLDSWPLTIPIHKGRDLAPGTRDSILDQLDDDLQRWEERLMAEKHMNGDGSADE